MLKIYDVEDYESLPLSKWNIKQPKIDEENRENPMLTGQFGHTIKTSSNLCQYNEFHARFYCIAMFIKFSGPLDLILVPGVAFTLTGGRCGHGMGYYDKYFHSYFDKYAKSRTNLIGLAFREQIVDENRLPIDVHDYPMDVVITSDDCEK